jgi:hypothetical protein
MQIEVKGRNLPVTDELREHVTRRFDKIAKQVSEPPGQAPPRQAPQAPRVAGCRGRPARGRRR